MNIKQAEEVFEKYHGHSFFSAKVNQVNKIEALYVPFWAASGSVRSKIINAQVGWDRLVTRYNKITKQNESSWETTWRSVQTRHEFTHTYPSTIPELQVYASYKYRRGFLNQIRSSSSILSAKTLEPQDMESTDPEDKRRGLQNRGLDPFTMKPSIALKFVKTAIEDNEVQKAEQWLVDNYRCDRARIMSMDFQYSELVLAPVYVPVYVFSVQYLDRTFRTFVQAHDAAGLVGGMRFYSWQRVSAATAICAIAGLAIVGTSRFGLDMTTGFWLGVVTPSLLVAWSVLYYPILDYRIRDWWRQREVAGHASEAHSATWDTNWTKAYDRFEEEQRRQDWNENQQYQRQSSYGSRASSSSSSDTGPPGDPLGYYATLGVSRDASVQEIQSAFRGLAMKWHPDRFSTPKEKAVGKKKFQEVTAAYSVLRDVGVDQLIHGSVMASYYFQEDSDEAPSSGGEDVPMPTFRLASPQIRDNIPPSTLPSVSTTTSASSPSITTPSTPVTTTSTKHTSPKQQTVTSISDGSISSSASPELAGDIRTFKDPAYVPELPMEDARSLAIAIEDQEMLSRSDLEESMLKNLLAPVKFLESENISILHASTDKHLPWTAQNQEHAIASMRFVPQTRVFYISKQYRTVFLLDVSSSVLTVDSGGSKIVMGQVMETLTKCLSGLAERFSCPGTKQDFVHPEIHVTVIAECSQFASNLHTGEMLANFPTMKVLLQDIVLTETNLQSVLRVLKIQLRKFQQRLSQFRSELRRTRESMGYILAVEDAVDDVTTELDLEDDISQRKSWGVGLSGANLSYTLTAGLFALGMMPNSASPSLVIITDGVVKSNLLHGSTILRRFMELDVSCSIIQLGSRDGVIPNSNWGFVQDTEALRFVTEATLGKFMFSQDCTWPDPRIKTQNLTQQRIAPNIYHRAFLIRELCLLKPRPGLDDIEEKDESPGYSLANFPWDPKSLPEPIKMMQTACKDYHLNIPVEMLIGARIRQGFRIKGVSIAPDRERPGLERYMITMTLAWLPNVTVQYKLKGQIGGKGPNYFSRFESPKVEIDIIAYQAFAIHFLNSQHAPVNANHSVYAKVFRIHRYIVGLSDSDVTLRSLNNSHSSANQAVWTLKTKARERQWKIGSTGSMSINQDDIAAYISRLSEQWSGLAKDADYQYSRGWYNEYEFDALLITPPPAFLPTAMDTKNSLVKYCEGLETTVQGIRDYLNDVWASFTVGDVFIRTCQGPESNAAATPNTRFCELRLFSEPNVAILRIQLRFFGLELLQRRAISKDLRKKIFNFKAARPNQGSTSKTESEVVQVKIVHCQRPIYKLLMRHLIYEGPLCNTPESALTDFHTQVSEPIGEESVLRSYMVHKHWGWKDQVRDTAYLLENNYMATQDLAFQYLCAQRLGEGFLLASVLPDRVAFYKEIELPRQKGTLLQGTSTVQYLIFRSQISRELVTELWMEPTTDACRHTQFDKIKSEIIAVDRFVLSRLATYEAIHTIGRLRLRPEVSPNPEGGFMYPWLFDPATLLRQQRLVTLAYKAPRRSSTFIGDGDVVTGSPRRCIHTFGLGVAHTADGTSSTLVAAANTARDLLLTRNANTSTTSLNQSLLEAEATLLNETDLVVDYKDQLRELCCTDRDLAILHLFMEKSLSQMADGEIMAGGEDDACSQFFLDIKTSIKQNSEVRQALMTFHCTNSFQDIRCFVKSVNAKFFRLIIVPKLGSVISHLTKLRSLPSREMDLARRDFLGCLMFECLRSKPLADVSEYNVNALDQSQALFELHPVSLGPVISQQPLLIQPVVNEDQGKARVQESTLQLIHSISQAYSHSFAKAIYASLIEGHTIESADLKKACQICTRTTVDINITGFLNTLEQGRRGGTIRQAYLTDETDDLKIRFMDVLKHSFELVSVPGSDQIYFYRPALRKTWPKLTKPRGRKRSPSVSRNGSIDADMEDALAEVIESADRPLFLHLECSFQKPLTQAAELERSNLKPSVTFPVTGLPVSYIYKEKDSRGHNYAPSSIGFESRPVDSADGTVAILHLVLSTLPMPEDYSGPTLKTIDSESKINIDSSHLSGPRSLQHIFPSLDPMQLEAIADTEARLEWLVKEEVMHGLLDMAPVTVDILNMVVTQLKAKSNFVKFPTAMTLPLTFVKKRRGHEIFMQELGRAVMDPFELHRVGPYFYLTEGDDVRDDGQMPEGSSGDLAAEPVEQSAQDDDNAQNDDLPSLSSGLQNDSSLSPSDDLCHGLGIVILPKRKSNTNTSSDVSNNRGRGQSRRKRSFWLILVPRDSYIQMYFFSKSLSEEACNSILDHVRKAIDELCVKVNQLTLLRSLNETRNCSKYLVPSDDSDPNADSESGSDSEQVSQEDEALVTGGSKPNDDGQAVRAFMPGEFAPPLVYRVAWPLHWRVKPGQATKSVANLVLYPFGVQNRKNFYVVESQDDYDETKKIVVFLRLSEVEVQSGPEFTSAQDEGRNSHLTVARGDEQSAQASVSSQTLEDSGSHVNSPRPSPTASPGSRTIAPPVIKTDTRELVIEVYGVDPPGKQVTVDLFSLLENKFYNSVVLPVVSTFLSRNSTLKLTQADVDFILPVDRLEPARQELEIPPFIKVPYAFLTYLKQNLCLYLSPLTGTDKVNALKKHYIAQYGRHAIEEKPQDRSGQSHQLQVGDFSFFYNLFQGRPQTPLESQVGVGVAGVCLTVLGQDKKPVSEIGYQRGDDDNESIRKYFESFPNSTGRTRSKYSLLIEIWAQGSVNSSALLEAICQSFRQSLCDDIIETSIACDLSPSARDTRNDEDGSDGEPLIGEHVQKHFIDPSFMVLQHANQLKSPAVQSLTLTYSMPPWIMDSFLLELDEILTDVSAHFSPLLIRSMADSSRYKEYRASSGTRKSFGDMTNIQFILIGGIQDLSDGSSSSYYGRRTSTASERSHSRRSSLAEGQSLHHSHKTSTHSSQQHPKRQLEDIKMYPNAIIPSGDDKTMLTRNCFVVITANGFGLQAYTYNWGKQYHEFMFTAIEKVVRWHRDRMRLLDNVLLQKMGLFHHVPSIFPTQGPPTLSTSSNHPISSNTPSLIQNLPRVGPQNSPHLSSSLRANHATDSGPGNSNTAKSSTSPKALATSTVFNDTTSLANLVEDQFPNRTRTLHAGSSVYGNDDNRSEMAKASSSVMSLVARPSPPVSSSAQVHTQPQILGQSSEQGSSTTGNIITTGLDADQILRDYCLEPLETPRDEDQIQDEVQRHGKPFLDTFNYHTKNAEDQLNAYNVYQKWSRRYRDRKDSPNALHENMNTSDLAIMLRSARLLHFCRTPLLFTEFSSSLFPHADHTSSTAFGAGAGTNGQPESKASDTTKDKDRPLTDPVVQWYSALADAFMREYSQYLATVGMQLLMYGNSKFDKPMEPSQSEDSSFMSQFTVSQTLTVESPAAFLFKSLQGGSIMCEVRLKGMFVCVTLYTLNRRYGRVKVAAPGFATAEANKQSLRVFTEQCARFKDRIHVNSFVYDFHLRYIHRILMESSKLAPPASPNAGMGFNSLPSTGLPSSFDLMDVLHQFLQYHSRPAAYSRNRVYRGVYRTNVGPGESELPGRLFEYVIKNPQRYGFQPIHHQNRPRACFIYGHDLLAGFSGIRQAPSPSMRSEHHKMQSETGGQGVKGFSAGVSRGGISLNSDHRTFGPHTRHTSHDSSLNTKKASRRMTLSRSSQNVKESAALKDEGVEYVLVLSDGEQDSMGLTVHYYLLILRGEEVVKKLEDMHGPLVGTKDRLIAASHNVLIMRDSNNISNIDSRSSFIANQLQAAKLIGDGDKTHPEQKHSDQDPSKVGAVAEATSISTGDRLMDATELQERITEHAVLADVVRAAEVRLDFMLKQAAQFFDRDSLWEMLLQGKIGNSGVMLTGSNSTLVGVASQPLNSPATVLSTEVTDYVSQDHGQLHASRQDNSSSTGSELGFSDFLALGQRFHSTPLADMEPAFRSILTAPGIDWNGVLTFLARYYVRLAREFMEHDETGSPGPAVSSLGPGPSVGGSSIAGSLFGRRESVEKDQSAGRTRRHLVIFNPHDRDLLVHFVINISNDTTENTAWSNKASGAPPRTQKDNNIHTAMRNSTGELYPRPDKQNRGLSTGSGVHSQSHSHLLTFLRSPSQPSLFHSQQSQSHYHTMSALQPQSHSAHAARPSLSETSNRVSSMTSIARAASLAVTKVASRFQPSRSRASSTAYTTLSQFSSRAPSLLLEDDGRESNRTVASKNGSDCGIRSLEGSIVDVRTSELDRSKLSEGQVRTTKDGVQEGAGREIQVEVNDEGSVVTDISPGDEEDRSYNRVMKGEDQNEDGEGDEDNDGDDGDSDGNEDDDDDDDGDDDGDDDDDDGYDDLNGANVRVFSVSREPKSGYNAVESEHVGDIIRTLSYWIWKSQK